MASIQLQDVTVQFGGRVVLDAVSLDLHSGRTVGVVGPNGAGKTTLFRVICGTQTPDMGRCSMSKGLRVGYLSQEPDVDLSRTLHDEALSAFDELLAIEQRMHDLSDEIAAKHDSPELSQLMQKYDQLNERFVAAGGYEHEQQLNEILGGLGFTESDYKLPISVLSGGQRCRVALAKLLLQDHTYLLLDEPTNHLDIDAVRWLERFLAGHSGGAAIISHDRYLLDRLAESIVEVDRARVRTYAGNYTAYRKTQERDELTQEREYTKDKAFIDKERDFIARHMAGQRTKEAQGRRKRLERLLGAGEFTTERVARKREVRFEFDVDPLPGRTMIEVREAAKGYADKSLFVDVTLQVASGERVGITGPNGTGKSTLLKGLLDLVEFDVGEVRIDPKAQIGYYSQQCDDLDPEHTVFGEICNHRPDLGELQVRSLLAQFHFRADDVFKPLGKLSGGEQSRVRLLKLLLSSPNVLVLDEPTNHLDIPSREALESALADYPGAILAVSHDRYFLDRLVQHLLVMRGGQHTHVRGNYSDYIQALEQQSADKFAAKSAKKGDSRKNAAKPKSPKPRGKFDRMGLRELEEQIMTLEAELQDFDKLFADPGVYKDAEAVVRLRTRLEEVKRELAEAERAWSRRADDA